MKTYAIMVYVRADSIDEARKCWRETGQLNHTLPVPDSEWPLWAKALKQFSKPEDKGIGDTVARMIGDEKSEAFKAWHHATFGKPCNCNGRQARWNRLYPLNQ